MGASALNANIFISGGVLGDGSLIQYDTIGGGYTIVLSTSSGAYDRFGHQMVTYNGFLYLIGNEITSDTSVIQLNTTLCGAGKKSCEHCKEPFQVEKIETAQSA